ncbi:MAG: ribbon-helix-helix protein, CopG family [Dehalococcoidia bacterium]
MTRKTKYGPPYRFAEGPDVDLEQEDVRDINGNRITEDYVREAVENVHRHVSAGRPSLTGPGEHSPHVSFRLPAELREAAKRRAQREGKSVSAVARDALREYLAG